MIYNIYLGNESFTEGKGLIVRGISHADPTDIVFTLPEEEGKRFQVIYDSLEEESKLLTELGVVSASADLTQDPPPTADIKRYALKVCNIDIDESEGLYVFTCLGRLKR